MYSKSQKIANTDVADQRREGGRWLRELRERAGLSQRDLAQLVGAEYYTFVSQLENGRGRVPPDRYVAFANAFKVDPRRFVRTLMKFYDPLTHDILFGETH